MEVLIEFGKLTIPAALVLYAMYLTVKSFIHAELDKKQLAVKAENAAAVMPSRLHAYERICLFLERISPGQLIARLNNGDYSAQEFRHILLNEIREEYNHNISQQLYMSEEAWNLIKGAKENLTATINEVAVNLPKEASGTDLSKAIFDSVMTKETDPVQHALLFLKQEIGKVF